MFERLKPFFLMLGFCLSFWTAFDVRAEAHQKVSFNDLSILVSSCDKYEEFWKPFFSLLFQQWPSLKTHNAHVKIYLITNQKNYSDPRVTVLQMGEDNGWSENMLRALKAVNTNYVLYLQEDYLMSAPVQEAVLRNLLDMMKAEKPAYVQVSREPYFAHSERLPHHPDIALKDRFAIYRTSLHAALWNKKTFEWLINPAENPEQFEVAGSVRSQGVREPFWSVQDNIPIQYYNACNAGYWEDSAVAYLKSQNLDLIDRRLPIRSEHTFKFWFRQKYPKHYKRLAKILPKFLPIHF